MTDKEFVRLQDRTELYRYSAEEAVRNHEEYEWEESFNANLECRKAMELALAESPMREDAARKLLNEFGYVRTGYVIVNSAQHMSGLPKETAEWAKQYYIVPDRVGKIDYNLQTAAVGRPKKLECLISQFREELEKLHLFTAKDCEPDWTGVNLEGKVLVLRPDSLKESCMIPENQLWLAQGGFGCMAHTLGRAVYATCLSDGERSRWNRQDFCGIISEENLPQWAREKLQEMQAETKREMKL